MAQPNKAIDVDGYLSAGNGEYFALRNAARIEHTGQRLCILTRAQAEQLIADLQASFAELDAIEAEAAQ
jgi:hypothetical protein